MSPSSRSSNMKTIFNRILNRNLVEKTFSREDNYTSFFFIAGFGIDRTRPPFFFMQEESGWSTGFSYPRVACIEYPVHPLIRTHRTYTLTLTVGGRRRASNACPRSEGLSNGVSCRLEWIRCISFTFTSERGCTLGITLSILDLFRGADRKLVCKYFRFVKISIHAQKLPVRKSLRSFPSRILAYVRLFA